MKLSRTMVDAMMRMHANPRIGNPRAARCTWGTFMALRDRGLIRRGNLHPHALGKFALTESGRMVCHGIENERRLASEF